MDEAAGSLVARLKEDDAKPEDRVKAGRWLIGLQSYAPVLELLGSGEPANHLNSLLLQFEALSGLGRWHECEIMLEAARGGALSDTLYFLLRARLADLCGEQEREESDKRQLRQAMKFSELPHVLLAARQAESFGWRPEAFAAWRILAAESSARPEALLGQLRTMPPSSTAAEGAELANALLGLQPDDPDARLTSLYYNLLSGKSIDTHARDLIETAPSDNVRRVAALAYLREGQAAKGLDVFPGDNGEDRWRAVHAALLHAAGQSAEAVEVARAINRDKLDAGEIDLLRAIAP